MAAEPTHLNFFRDLISFLSIAIFGTFDAADDELNEVRKANKKKTFFSSNEMINFHLSIVNCERAKLFFSPFPFFSVEINWIKSFLFSPCIRGESGFTRRKKQIWIILFVSLSLCCARRRGKMSNFSSFLCFLIQFPASFSPQHSAEKKGTEKFFAHTADDVDDRYLQIFLYESKNQLLVPTLSSSSVWVW